MSFALIRSLIITGPLIALATAVMGSISLLASLFDSTGRAQHAVSRAWARMLLVICRVTPSVEGLENIRPDGAYVFASNHLSYIDTPLVLSFIPAQFRFLAKEGLFYVPFLGYHLKRAGHVSVPREDARASIRVMNEAARIIRERGVSVLVFPEGERTDGRLMLFKEGGAYIAIKAGAPIVPVAVQGTREILARGHLTVRGGPVQLKVGEPILTHGLTTRDRRRLTAQVRDRIAELLGVQAAAAAK